MSVAQQYLLDTCRARQLGEPVLPVPGTHDVRGVREWHDPPSVPGRACGAPRVRPRRAALRRWRYGWPRGAG